MCFPTFIHAFVLYEQIGTVCFGSMLFASIIIPDKKRNAPLRLSPLRSPFNIKNVNCHKLFISD